MLSDYNNREYKHEAILILLVVAFVLEATFHCHSTRVWSPNATTTTTTKLVSMVGALSLALLLVLTCAIWFPLVFDARHSVGPILYLQTPVRTSSDVCGLVLWLDGLSMSMMHIAIAQAQCFCALIQWLTTMSIGGPTTHLAAFCTSPSHFGH